MKRIAFSFVAAAGLAGAIAAVALVAGVVAGCAQVTDTDSMPAP